MEAGRFGLQTVLYAAEVFGRFPRRSALELFVRLLKSGQSMDSRLGTVRHYARPLPGRVPALGSQKSP